MKKLCKIIIVLALLFGLYLGCFGVKQWGIDPFIVEWLQSDKPRKMGKTIEQIGKGGEDILDTIEDTCEEIGEDVEEIGKHIKAALN